MARRTEATKASAPTHTTPTQPTLAHLGPAGTYSELAAKAYSPKAKLISAASIAEVFDLVHSGRVAQGIAPLENIIQGPITETLDALRASRGSVRIVDTRILEIEHALGMPKGSDGVALTKIKYVVSHIQPLQQCSSFLKRELGAATAVPCESTASALDFVRSKAQLHKTNSDSAVIAPLATLKNEGFVILAENIADRAGNKTRFCIIKKADPLNVTELSVSEAQAADTPTRGAVTSIVISPGRDRQALLFELLQIISIESGVNIESIHSRPDHQGGFVFHLDLEGDIEDATIRSALSKLYEFCREKTGETAELNFFGSYKKTPFFDPPFTKIAIVGAKGAMGSWFSKFFSTKGFEVVACDKGDKQALDSSIKDCEVVVLSVPMSEVEGIRDRLSRAIRPGQLVVENCSIKNTSLPLLEQLPDGVEVLGMHTMFGETTEALKGENVIFTQTERSGALARSFEDLFYKHGAHVSHKSSAEHDQVVAFVQSLLHLSVIAMGEVLCKSFDSPKQLEQFQTPNSRMLFAMLAKVVGQKDELLSDLQLKNPEASRIRLRYLETLFRLVSTLECGEHKELCRAADEIRKFLSS